MHRKTKYKPEYDRQAKLLAEKGLTDVEMAEFFEVAESTFHLWKKKNPSFSESLKAGKVFSDAKVVESLYERALGREYTEIKTEEKEGDQPKTTKTTRLISADTTAAIFWLKNRQPDQWREKAHQDINLNVDTPLAERLKNGSKE